MPLGHFDFNFNFTDDVPVVVVPPTGRLMTASPPMGLDDGHIFARVVPEIVTGTATYDMTSDYIDVLPSGHLIITDKAAFYGAMPVTVDCTITGTNGPELVNVQCSPIAGYTDIELFRHNMVCHFDTGSNLGRATDDADSTFIYDVEDHGHIQQVTAGAAKSLYAWNPWFADRRPVLQTSLMNPERKCMHSTPPASTGSTYGLFLAQKGTDILNSKWNGIRYLRFDGVDTGLQMTRDLEPQNSSIRINTTAGNDLVGRTIILVISWDASGQVVMRINGVEVSRQAPAVYKSGQTVSGAWTPPANPGILIFVGYAETTYVNHTACIISHTAIGQHPWWEGSGWDGDWGEYVEILNVTGQV